MTFLKQASAGYLTNHLARLLAQRLQQRLAIHGLALGAFPALLELWEEEGLTQKQVIEKLDIEQATSANTLNRMERDGLIARQRDVNDGRVQRIYLTEKARGLEAVAKAEAAGVNSELFSGIDTAEREAFVATKQKLITQLKS